MTSTDPWPEDPAFQMLARRVRDGVMIAEHEGLKISRKRGDNCCCPLGATLLMLNRNRATTHPSASYFCSWLDRPRDCTETYPDEKMIWAFICGFEEGIESASLNYAVKAAARLGVVYRERCLKRKAARHDPRPRRTRLDLTGKSISR